MGCRGDGEIFSSGRVQEMSGGGGSLWYGLEGMVVFSQKLDLIILEVFSDLNDFMIPCRCLFVMTCDSD